LATIGSSALIGFVAGKHAALKKSGDFSSTENLKIPVKEFLRDPFFKAFGQIVCVNYLHYTSQFLPGNQSKRYGVGQSKEAVATDRESEQFIVLMARTAD